jgi:hypothetical protein
MGEEMPKSNESAVEQTVIWEPKPLNVWEEALAEKVDDIAVLLIMGIAIIGLGFIDSTSDVFQSAVTFFLGSCSTYLKGQRR